MNGETIVRCEEDALGPAEQATIASLLDRCFPDSFSGRTYFKQLPTFRFLARLEGRLIGHVGVEHRMMRIGDRPVRVFGIVDLCVDGEHRRQGYGERLVEAVLAAGRAAAADVAMLFADDHRLYEACGFTCISQRCLWFAIDEHRSLGLQEELLEDVFMVRPLELAEWPAGETLDMLGYLF